MRFDRLFSLDWETLAEQMSDLPEADAKRLSSFFDHLLSDVVYQQLLPEAFASVSRMTGYEFTFRPEIRPPKDPWSPGCCSIAVAVSSLTAPPHQVLAFFSSPVYSGVLADFRGRERQLAHVKIVLLNRLLSGKETQLDMQLNDSCLPPTAFVQFDNESCQRIVVKFKPNCRARLQDLVADLIANGYDLTALLPFLAA